MTKERFAGSLNGCCVGWRKELRIARHLDQQFLRWERLPDNLANIEIEHLFTLSAGELEIASHTRRGLNRLEVASHIGCLGALQGLLH
jgi:hypothetical protein